MVKDLRRFKRYTRRCSAKISLKSAPYHVEILDYSLEGVGVIVKDALQLNKGDVLRIDSDELNLLTKCSVEWWSKTPHGIRVGLRKFEPLRGSLEHYSLADVFIGLQRSLKTGVFSITSGTVEKKIYLKNGDMIFAASNKDEDRLGDILLREGKITQGDFDRSSELIRTTGKRQGTILIELGAIAPKDLFWAVKHQVTEIILSFFTLAEGTFSFQESYLPTDELITLKLSAGNLIYQGIKRPTCIEQAREYLTLPHDTVIGFSPNPLDLFQDIALDGDDKSILSLIDGRKNLRDLITLTGFEESTVRRSVAALLSTSLIEIVQPADIRRKPPVKEKEAEKGALKAEDVLAETVAPPDIIEKIEKMYREHQKLDYYSLLGIEESASESKIRWAFYRLAKEFHPDRHFYLDGDMKDRLHAIFSYITNAYNVLSSAEKRRAYDRSLSTREQAVSKTEQAKKKFEEGLVEFHNKNYLDASQFFSEAVYLNDTSARYQYYLGVVLAKLNRLKEAARVMTKASELSPDNDEIITELGAIYVGLGFPLRAKRHFEHALKLNPSNQKAKAALSA